MATIIDSLLVELGFETETAGLDKFKKGIKDSLGLAKKLAAGMIAGSAAIIGAAASVGRYSKELGIASQRSGESVEALQGIEAAFASAGFNLEKTSDVLKDVNERIGEFAAVGSGPFQDFADVMGMTEEQAMQAAKQFEKMTATDVLLTMVAQMEAAGKSGQQMSFVLESLASDTTDLIPLLRDGGAEMKRIVQLSAKGILTKEQTDEAKKFSSAMGLLQTSLRQSFRQFLIPLMPVLTDLFQRITIFVYENIDSIKEWGQQFANAIKWAIENVDILAGILGALFAGKIFLGFAQFIGYAKTAAAVLKVLRLAMIALVSWPALIAVAIGAAAFLIYKYWDEIKEFGVDLKEWFFDLIDIIIDYIKGIPSRLGNFIQEKLQSVLPDKFLSFIGLSAADVAAGTTNNSSTTNQTVNNNQKIEIHGGDPETVKKAVSDGTGIDGAAMAAGRRGVR